MEMKAKLMHQDRERKCYENYRGSSSSSLGEKGSFNNCFNAGRNQEDKAIEKRLMNEPRNKGTQAQETTNLNSYTKPVAIKSYRYN